MNDKYRLILYGVLALVAFEVPYLVAGWDITSADVLADAVSLLAVQGVTVAYLKGYFPFSGGRGKHP